jgi:predicted PhzF superfamily epimerase YddE/YHI9
MTETTLHVLRVFLGPGDRGGNGLGVFLDGPSIPQDRRQPVATELGFAETVFVDRVANGTADIRIFTPARELPFAGHPTVGTSWLLSQVGRAVERLRPPAGDVATWHDPDADRTWVRARPEWIHEIAIEQLPTARAVEALTGPPAGQTSWYPWAWIDEAAGELRSRYFFSGGGITEDEATGAAAVLIGSRLGRPLVIRQGVGSELHARPGPDGSVEVGGRSGFLEERRYHDRGTQ